MYKRQAETQPQRTVMIQVEIKILRHLRAAPSRRPPRHRRDACSTAWRCRFLTARPSQHDRVLVHPTHWLICAQARRGGADAADRAWPAGPAAGSGHAAAAAPGGHNASNALAAGDGALRDVRAAEPLLRGADGRTCVPRPPGKTESPKRAPQVPIFEVAVAGHRVRDGVVEIKFRAPTPSTRCGTTQLTA